jgi:hypothetical protein
VTAVAILTSWDAPVVRQLLAAPGVELASFPRADAYLALYPYLSRLVLPEGVADLGRDIPPADVVLLAQKSRSSASSTRSCAPCRACTRGSRGAGSSSSTAS